MSMKNVGDRIIACPLKLADFGLKRPICGSVPVRYFRTFVLRRPNLIEELDYPLPICGLHTIRRLPLANRPLAREKPLH